MNLLEAIAKAIAGERITRRAWKRKRWMTHDASRGSMEFRPGRPTVATQLYAWNANDPAEKPCLFFGYGDVIAEDWEVME